MPRTVNELMVQAAEALNARDADLLESLVSHVEGWMQDDESLEAQRAMLNSMLEVVWELED